MAQAAQATSPAVAISLPVNSPTCTVSNSGSAITLPAASVGQTVGSYQALNLPDLAATSSIASFGTTYMRTSTSLRQTATISCSAANTAITSFYVKPGPGAKIVGTLDSVQYLIDATTPTPVMAAGGAGGLMAVVAEQLSVNGNAALYAYTTTNTGVINPYTTPFNTGALNTAPTPVSTATVVWQPVIAATAGDPTKFTAPTGGSYNGSFQIVVNY